MSDEQKDQQAGQTPPSSEAWQEVGRQFQLLGETLAEAVRASVNDPQHRQRLNEMQGGLENMVKEVDKAITDAAASPHAQQARSEATKAAESLRSATEQTIQDVRPRLLDALKQVNEELRRFVSRMEHRTDAPPPSDGPKDQE
jgi:hypothetical protein